MSVSINRAVAEEKLLAALKAKSSKNDWISKDIASILNGNHKTYKYVLITGLLAKASNNQADPLSLQSGAPLTGAYDARSLCHSVVVPFERDFLESALGGSNEPFLNKPARFTHLADTNAVRDGDDRKTLESLIKVLSAIKSSDDAFEYLASALEVVSKRSDKLRADHDAAITRNPTLIEVYSFILRILSKSFEGETCVLIVATLEKLYHQGRVGNYRVVAHKVNQSGASSKEIGDIDIFKDDSFKYAIEVKDKNFSEHDVAHAFNKVLKNGGERAAFIYGPNAHYDPKTAEKTVEYFDSTGLFVVIRNIYPYVRNTLFLLELEDKAKFVQTLFDCTKEINCKEETVVWIQDWLSEMKWK